MSKQHGNRKLSDIVDTICKFGISNLLSKPDKLYCFFWTKKVLRAFTQLNSDGCVGVALAMAVWKKESWFAPSLSPVQRIFHGTNSCWYTNISAGTISDHWSMLIHYDPVGSPTHFSWNQQLMITTLVCLMMTFFLHCWTHIDHLVKHALHWLTERIGYSQSILEQISYW